MGMQSAQFNPQAATGLLMPQPAAATQWPMAPLPLPTQGLGTTQLPHIPQPPFLQTPSQISPIGGDDLPTPDQLLSKDSSPAMTTTSYVIPGVFGTPQANGSQANPAYQTAHSVPLYNLESEADVPSPYMVAPWVYLAKPQHPPVPQQPLQMAQQPMQPWPPVQQPAAAQPKMPTPTPPPPPQPYPQAQPQQPPQQPQQPQPPAQQQPPTQPKTPTAPLEGSGLSDSVIRSLNTRLNDDNEDTRADAAMDLFKILDKDPTLAERDPYNKYVNAFMEKIMKDPSPVVRGAGELALQMGRVKNPSPGIKEQIKKLDLNPGNLTGEGSIISTLVGQIERNALGANEDHPAGSLTSGLTSAQIPGQTTPSTVAAQQPTAAQQVAAPNGVPQTVAPQPEQKTGFWSGLPGGLGNLIGSDSQKTAQQAKMPQQGVSQPPQAAPGAYAPPQAVPKVPQGAAQSMYRPQQNGERLNVMSSQTAPMSQTGMGYASTPGGQRLNIQEGNKQ